MIDRFKALAAEKVQLKKQVADLVNAYAPLIERHIALEDLVVGMLNAVEMDRYTWGILNEADKLGFKWTLEDNAVVWGKNRG